MKKLSEKEGRWPDFAGDFLFGQWNAMRLQPSTGYGWLDVAVRGKRD
jgi:hypothetical protein